MNKELSFVVSGIITALSIGAVWLVDKTYFDKHGTTPHLLTWYMLWKLFHDKKKDE